MYVVFCKIDHCIHIHWCIVMGLGHNDPWVESHMWPQQTWVKGHLGVNDLWFKFLEKRVSVSTYFDVFSNLILQWLQKYVIAKAGETRGSRTALCCFGGVELAFTNKVMRHNLSLTGSCFTCREPRWNWSQHKTNGALVHSNSSVN